MNTKCWTVRISREGKVLYSDERELVEEPKEVNFAWHVYARPGVRHTHACSTTSLERAIELAEELRVT